MKKFLMYLWQLPQNLLGLLMLIGKKEKVNYFCHDDELITVYYKPCFRAGVSLGNYIILDPAYRSYFDLINTVNHEHGHQKQSRYLGWLYLLVIGLPSALGNLWDRLAHIPYWTDEERIKWYYSQPWEAWADKLGGVTRC